MEVNKKQCRKCLEIKDRSQFYRKSKNKDGLQGDCKECHKKYLLKNKKNVLNALYKWRNKNKDKVAQQRLKTIYKISTEDSIKAYRLIHNGSCMICGQSSEKRNLHLDHDHKTKKIRGILCVNCNSAIGKLKESPEIFKKALEYILSPPGINS